MGTLYIDGKHIYVFHSCMYSVHPSPHVLTLFCKHISGFLSYTLTNTSCSPSQMHFYAGILLNMASPNNNQQQHTPPRVPDFFSMTTKERQAQLSAYHVTASNNKTKEALADQVKKHYINETLPGKVKKYHGYLNYQSINYRFNNQNNLGFNFRCTKYLRRQRNTS